MYKCVATFSHFTIYPIVNDEDAVTLRDCAEILKNDLIVFLGLDGKKSIFLYNGQKYWKNALSFQHLVKVC